MADRNRQRSRGSHLGRVLALALIGSSLVVACSSSSTKAKQPTKTAGSTVPVVPTLFPLSEMNKAQTEGTPVQGGSLTFGLESALTSIEPGMIQQPSEFAVADAVYDPIVGFDDKGLAAPTALASGWTPSSDLKTWTFTLRPGILFSDGSKVDAAAVVTQINALRAVPNCGCAADVAHIKSATAVSEYVVQFKLDQANVAFPGFLAGNSGFLAAPAAWAAGAASMTSNPIGSGPFKVLASPKLTFVRNPSYWRKSSSGHQLPYLDKITFVTLPDSAARLAALRAGTVDIFQTADTLNLVQAKKDTSLVVQPISGSSSTIIVLNSHKPPFDDLRMRQAFNYALDREALNKGYYSDSRLPAYGPLDPSNPYYDAEGQLPSYNPTLAKKLVDEVRADGKPTSFTSICISTTEATSVFAIINRLDRAVGMASSLNTLDQGALVTTLAAKDGGFEASCYRNAQVADPDDLYTSFYRTGGQNISLTNDLALDEALRDGRKSADTATRKAAYNRVQQLISKDVTVVPLLFDLYGNVHTKRVSGLSLPHPNALGLIDPADLYLVQ